MLCISVIVKSNKGASMLEVQPQDLNVFNKITNQQEQLLHFPEYNNIAYAPNSGSFWRLSPKGTYMTFPNIDNMIFVRMQDGKATHKKVHILAWEITNKRKLPEGYIVYAKDMNQENLKANNLGVIPRVEYKLLRDAIANVKGALKFSVQSSGKFYVKYREDNRIKTKKFSCEETAKEFKQEILRSNTMLLAKYHVST